MEKINDEMREACGLCEAFEAWKDGNERWEYASPLTAFQAAYQLQQTKLDKAVSALEFYPNSMLCQNDIAQQTLAEIKGE